MGGREWSGGSIIETIDEGEAELVVEGGGGGDTWKKDSRACNDGMQRKSNKMDKNTGRGVREKIMKQTTKNRKKWKLEQ